MQILGNRVLVSRLDEETKEGFQTVDVVDSFIYKGMIEQVGEDPFAFKGMSTTSPFIETGLQVGQKVIFAKYSPDTQEIEHGGQKMKIVNIDDILAIL